jgi:hypothetical protein
MIYWPWSWFAAPGRFLILDVFGGPYVKPPDYLATRVQDILAEASTAQEKPLLVDMQIINLFCRDLSSPVFCY